MNLLTIRHTLVEDYIVYHSLSLSLSLYHVLLGSLDIVVVVWSIYSHCTHTGAPTHYTITTNTTNSTSFDDHYDNIVTNHHKVLCVYNYLTCYSCTFIDIIIIPHVNSMTI